MLVKLGRILAIFFALVSMGQTFAMDLDWHGQFRAETHWLWGYSHGQFLSNPATDQGYFIPLNGSSPASFQNLFLRLDPRAIVNDNITIHTDIWVGTPDRGMFGSDAPNTGPGKYNTTRTGTASITMNEYYADIASDFGTIRVGRAPLNWGLGLVWNNTHADFDRLPSTGDEIGLIAKLGAFKVMPAMVKYRLGSNLGGSYTGTTTNSTIDGWSGAADYVLGLTYSNPDEQVEAGVMFMRRLSGVNAQYINPLSISATAPGVASYDYNLWDFTFNKKIGIFSLAAEIPLVSGQIAGVSYSTVAGAINTKAQINDHWMVKLNAGQADGQATLTTAVPTTKVTAFYFHPDYRPGLILFNYNRKNFSSISTAAGTSPFDAPVSNARFLNLGVDYTIGKWSHGMEVITASALETADGVVGHAYFNSSDGYFHTQNAGATKQETGLGFEVDYLLGYQWDDSFRLGWELGLLFPGKFYEFSNSATLNTQKTVFASTVNISVKF